MAKISLILFVIAKTGILQQSNSQELCLQSTKSRQQTIVRFIITPSMHWSSGYTTHTNVSRKNTITIGKQNLKNIVFTGIYICHDLKSI